MRLRVVIVIVIGYYKQQLRLWEDAPSTHRFSVIKNMCLSASYILWYAMSLPRVQRLHHGAQHR